MFITLASLAEEVPPLDAPSGSYGFMFFKMICALALLVALMVLSAYVLRRLIQRRLQRSSSKPAIHVLEKKMLSPKTMLYLVEVEHRKVLIAESHLEVRRMHVVTEESPPSSPPSSLSS